ncbi:MAG TPA: D-alanyl-D-alanine carboxypeptidase/D-alanyl-D-alanine-endopeptidase [Gammaproteobacteria bacterium]|nr:D-alanyl-D-alanine carboxypeptidase/D-alanyl-D-alanine-endopeptidase [Gammaproteobacteria bacterium]
MRALPLIVLCLAAGSASADLPSEVQSVLTALKVPADDVSVVVQAVDAAEPALSHLPDVARNPASVMKTVTTWTALESLGPTFEWSTEVYFLGPFDGKTLDGDIAFKGYGDPYLVEEEVWKMLRALRRAGLEEIKGDFIFDDSYFTVDDDAPGAFDGEPYRSYNVVPNALLMNFKAVQFQIVPDRDAGKVRVTTDPILSNLEVVNGIKLGDGSCGGFQRGVSFDHANSSTLDRAVLGGEYSRRCNAYSLSRTVLQHDTYAFGLFSALWKEVGGKFSGKLKRAVVPPGSSPQLIWSSVPLAEAIRSINKNSNNVMTRQLVYTLGAQRFGAPGTRDNGVRAIREFLEGRGIDVAPLAMRNGAGLSRDERVSARLLVGVLRAAAKSPFGPEFMASLSLGGMDGTMRNRFNGGSIKTVTHVKTGRLDDVSALAGYVHGPEHTYAMAVIVNSKAAERGPGEEIEEAVVRWIQARP